MAKEIYMECTLGTSNKFYHMVDQDDGTFIGFYGKIHHRPQGQKVYPIRDWYNILDQKMYTKGYEVIERKG